MYDIAKSLYVIWGVIRMIHVKETIFKVIATKNLDGLMGELLKMQSKT